MADGTNIEWTDATWNVVNGCSVTSPGCKHCYAMKQAHRVEARRGLTEKTAGGMVWTGEVRFNEKVLEQPLRWKKPRRIFVCAHGDLFHESVPDEWIDRVFAVMALCPQHTFQVLTKRSARMREYFEKHRDAGGPCKSMAIIWDQAIEIATEHGCVPQYRPSLETLPNVWLGVSVEDQTRADERIPDLLATPAAVRFLSCEPLLAPVDLALLHHDGITNIDALRGTHGVVGMSGDCAAIDWVIVGGESGPKARPMHPDWARSLRDQCAAAGVPFLFKQWGEWAPCESENGTALPGEFPAMRVGKKRAGRLLDGVQHDGFPHA